MHKKALERRNEIERITTGVGVGQKVGRWKEERRREAIDSRLVLWI